MQRRHGRLTRGGDQCNADSPCGNRSGPVPPCELDLDPPHGQYRALGRGGVLTHLKRLAASASAPHDADVGQATNGGGWEFQTPFPCPWLAQARPGTALDAPGAAFGGDSGPLSGGEPGRKGPSVGSSTGQPGRAGRDVASSRKCQTQPAPSAPGAKTPERKARGSITGASRMAAMIFRSPPQFGQCSRSSSGTRLSSRVQLIRTGLRCAQSGSQAAGCDASARSAGPMAPCARILALGASTPWKRTGGLHAFLTSSLEGQPRRSMKIA